MKKKGSVDILAPEPKSTIFGLSTQAFGLLPNVPGIPAVSALELIRQIVGLTLEFRRHFVGGSARRVHIRLAPNVPGDPAVSALEVTPHFHELSGQLSHYLSG